MDNPFETDGRHCRWNGVWYDPPRKPIDLEATEPIMARLSGLNIIWLIVDNPDPINLYWGEIIDENNPLTENGISFGEHYQKQMLDISKMPIVRENYMEFYQKD